MILNKPGPVNLIYWRAVFKRPQSIRFQESGIKPLSIVQVTMKYTGQILFYLRYSKYWEFLRKLKEITPGMEENAEVFLPINQLPVSIQTEAIKIWKSNPLKYVESIEFRSGGETW